MAVTNRLAPPRSTRLRAADIRLRVGALRRFAPAAIATLAATIALTAVTAAPPADAAVRRAACGAPHRGGPSAAGGRADHGHRVDQRPAGDLLRCRRLDLRARCRAASRDARTTRLRRHREGQGPPFEPLLMPGCRTCCAWPGTASRCTAGPCYAASHGCVRMVPISRPRVRQGADGRAGDHLADTEPVAFTDPVLVSCRSRRRSMPRARAKTRRRSRPATEAAAAAKAAVAMAIRTAATAPAAVRKLTFEKRADAEFTHIEKVLAPPSGRSQGQGSGCTAEGQRQGAGVGHATRCRQGRPQGKAGRLRGRRRPRRPRPSASSSRRDGCEARYRAGLGLCQPRHAEALRSDTSRFGWRRAVRYEHRSSAHQGSRQAARHAHLYSGGARRWRRPALDRSHDRQRGNWRYRQGGHIGAAVQGGARSHRTDIRGRRSPSRTSRWAARPTTAPSSSQWCSTTSRRAASPIASTRPICASRNAIRMRASSAASVIGSPPGLARTEIVAINAALAAYARQQRGRLISRIPPVGHCRA